MLGALPILFALAAAPVGPAAAQDSAPQPASAAREIKPPPAVPPDKAAKPLASVQLVNAGFESTTPGKLGSPEGWLVVQHAGPVSYTFEPDTTIRPSSRTSP